MHRYFLHESFEVPLSRDGLLVTTYVFGTGMFAFFLVSGVYDGAIVYSFALGFLLIVVMEEWKEAGKLQAFGMERACSTQCLLWLAHTTALIAIVLGYIVSLGLTRALQGVGLLPMP